MIMTAVDRNILKCLSFERKVEKASAMFPATIATEPSNGSNAPAINATTPIN